VLVIKMHESHESIVKMVEAGIFRRSIPSSSPGCRCHTGLGLIRSDAVDRETERVAVRYSTPESELIVFCHLFLIFLLINLC